MRFFGASDWSVEEKARHGGRAAGRRGATCAAFVFPFAKHRRPTTKEDNAGAGGEGEQQEGDHVSNVFLPQHLAPFRRDPAAARRRWRPMRGPAARRSSRPRRRPRGPLGPVLHRQQAAAAARRVDDPSTMGDVPWWVGWEVKGRASADGQAATGVLSLRGRRIFTTSHPATGFL